MTVPRSDRDSWRTSLGAMGSVVGIMFALAVTALFYAITQWSPFVLRLEHQLADWRTGLLSDRKPTQHERLAIILIDDATLANEPYTSPVDRLVLAKLVTRLDQLGAKAIALDIAFYRPTDPMKDDALLAAIRASKATVILAAGDERTAAVRAVERAFQTRFIERSGRQAGYANIDEDADDVIRRRLGPAKSGGLSKSFATLLAQADGKSDPNPSARMAWLRKPVDQSDTFFAINATELIGEGAVADLFASQIKDRLVLVGGSFADRDLHRVPLFPLDCENGQNKIHGVFLHAYAVAQVLDNRRVTELPQHPVVFILSLLGFSLGWSFRRAGFSWLTGTGWLAGLIIIDLMLFWQLRLIVPYMPAVAAWVAGGFGGYWLGRITNIPRWMKQSRT